MFLAIFFLSMPAFAQGVDWDKIGQPMGDDTRDVYDRYVYFDEDKTTDLNVALSHPILSLQAMGFWLSETIPQIMALSGASYRQGLKDIQPFFTDKGYRAFIRFLDQQKISSRLEQTRSDLSVVVEMNPDILADAVFNGVYRWNVDVPLLVSYRNSNIPQQKMTINLDVVRVPFGKNSDGLAFDFWEIKYPQETDHKTLDKDVDPLL